MLKITDRSAKCARINNFIQIIKIKFKTPKAIFVEDLVDFYTIQIGDIKENRIIK